VDRQLYRPPSRAFSCHLCLETKSTPSSQHLRLLHADANVQFLRYLVYALSGDVKLLGDMTERAARYDPGRVPFDQNGADGA